MILNSATQAAITKLDVVFPEASRKRSYEDLPSQARNFIERVEAALKIPVVLIGTGTDAEDIIDRRKSGGDARKTMP